MSSLLRKRSNGWGTDAPEQEYWLSYSDLMAGLLMVFVLMLLISLDQYGGPAKVKLELDGANASVVKELQQQFADSRDVSVDPTTGAIRFRDAVLFREGSAVILPDGKQILREFAPKYMKVLAGNPKNRKYLQSIAIEGHTNDNGSYMYNLDLSQRRAFAVMQFLLENTDSHRGDLRRFATANGESFRRQLCKVPVSPGKQCPSSKVDKAGSRRIEIRFRLAIPDTASSKKTLAVRG